MSSPYFRRFHHALQDILDLVFPPQCAGCNQSGSILCPACATSIRPRSLLPPRYDIDGISCLYTVNSYQGTLRTCIHALKYKGVTRLAEPLGMLLSQLYLSYHVGADMLMPVPLHPDRYRQRGYNHAELLARVCAEKVGVPFASHLLVRTRATPAQVGLNADQRQQNMVNAFRVPATKAILGRKIVIVDDVCTTGATLEACATSLLLAGATSVQGLVLARPM
jgi:ComF family protein